MFSRQANRQLIEHQRRIGELQASIDRMPGLEHRITALEATHVLAGGLHDWSRQGAFTLLGSSIVGASFLGAETIYLYQNHGATAVNLSLLFAAFTLIAVSALSGAGAIGLSLWQRWPSMTRWIIGLQAMSLALSVVLAVVAVSPALGTTPPAR